MAESELDEVQSTLSGVGPRLLAAREAAGLSRSDIAARTKIGERHLAAIEAGKFSDLASRAYAVGFSRSYARVVGLDEKEIAISLRGELGMDDYGRVTDPGSFEPGDPARVPGARLAWISALGALAVVLAGYAYWRHQYRPALDLPDLSTKAPVEATESPAAAAQAPAPVAPPVDGAVTFTALESGIWVKFYDGNGRQLMQKQMALNESYTVPADAVSPRMWTGRPEAFAITVGGRAIPKLADVQKTMKDVPVTAAALLARPPAPPAIATPAAIAAPGTPANSTTLP